MKLYYGLLAGMLVAGLALSGCVIGGKAPILKVEKECTVGKFGGVSCRCRDKETGQFLVCPPEWRAR